MADEESGALVKNQKPDETTLPQTDTTNDPESKEAVQRAMRKMAERAPEEFVEMTAMMGTMMGHPLHQKMNDSHITKMLDLAVQHDTNEFSLRKSQQETDHRNGFFDRCSHLFYFAVFVGLVIFVIWVFKDKPEVLAPILTGVGGIVTGFMGGLGYAKVAQTSRKKSG